MRRTVPHVRLALTFAAAVVAVAGTATRAHAQQRDPEARATRGVYIADATRAGDADATGVQLNPAQIGFLPAFNLALAAGVWGESAPLPGRGVGIFLAAPLGHTGLGLGLSHVGATASTAAGPGVQAHTVFQLAYALRFGRSTSLGASWTHVWESLFAGADTFDVGLSQRFGRYLALSLVVEDVGQPVPSTPGSASLPRLWAGEMALRPLATNRLELGLGAAHLEDDSWRNIVPWARFGAYLARGFRLYGRAESLPNGSQYALSGDADYRVSVGFTLDFDQTSATVGTNVAAGAGDGRAGAAALLRVDGTRRPPVVSAAVVTLVSLDGLDGEREYFELVRRLRALAADPNVAGVLLKLENVDLGLGRIEEVRDLVAALRARGKRVFAYGPFPSTRAYYLAVACDGIVVHPAGALSLTGFAQTVTFYKRAMDKLGVNVDLVRIGDFKGAMEPFILTEQSAPVRENKDQLLDETYGRLVAAIATGRSRVGRTLDATRIRALIDRGLFTPLEAQLAGLIDAVKDEAELEEYIRQTMGRSVAVREFDATRERSQSWPSRRLAVVLVEGAMVDGPGRQFPFALGKVAGSDTLVAALEECRRDPTVAAVVLRVNTPGGAAFAADVIARAVQAVRKAGKPVVVSMGDSATSGGYYIAAPGDVVFAEPSTITGSIGIFGYKVDVGKLAGVLGVSTETFKRGQHADYFSPYRPWTDEEIRLAGEKIRHFYGLFLNTVVEGRRDRGLTLARVDEIGRGHLWTGSQALGLGLVDRMGGLGAAIDEAARRARLPLGRDGQPEIAILPRASGGPLQRLLSLTGQSEAPAPTPDLLGAGALVRLLLPLLLGPGSGIEARHPYDVEIR